VLPAISMHCYVSRTLGLLLAIASCAGPSASYTPLGAPPEKAYRTLDQIEIYMRDEVPKRATRSFARVQTENPGFSCSNIGGGLTEARSLDLIRQEAAHRGADGALDVRCGEYGTVGVGQCTGSLFVYE
jgi:hypothetical protein